MSPWAAAFSSRFRASTLSFSTPSPLRQTPRIAPGGEIPVENEAHSRSILFRVLLEDDLEKLVQMRFDA